MEQPVQKNWWGRNWKWFVPTTVLGIIIVCCGCPSSMFIFGMKTLKAQTFYVDALEKATNNEQVVTALGSPIEPSWMVQGNVKIENNTGTADMQIPITGPNGSGTISLEADKSGDVWTFTKLSVIIDATGEKIDLLMTDVEKLIDKLPDVEIEVK